MHDTSAHASASPVIVAVFLGIETYGRMVRRDTHDRQYSATVAALIGIGPKDELEGMMAAQLIAAHNAAMECYRRAMIGLNDPAGNVFRYLLPELRTLG